MLFNLLYPLSSDLSFLNVFRYLTFRTGGALITALLISFVLGPSLIRWLRRKQREGQPIRSDGPERHLIEKRGTPTMGGVLILTGAGLSTLLWADLTSAYVWIVLMVTLGFGLIGFADDYLKVVRRNPKGLPGKMKLLLQTLIGVAAAVWVQYIALDDQASGLAIPFVKNVLLDLGLLYVPFAVFVMIGSSNAVNLTDVFMGDTGSLSLGGALGAISVVTKHELVLAVIGGLFVLETVSVMVQVASFKLTGKRVFRMAPLHHHFEKKGWAESTIVIRFWIIAFVLALIGLSTLKLR